MTVEFIGYIGSHLQSEIIPYNGPAIDLAHIEEAARVHDEGGFDRALVAFGSTSPESQHIVAYASTVVKCLHFMIAHRPGFTAPTLAARQLATLDQLTGGRIGVHTHHRRRRWGDAQRMAITSPRTSATPAPANTLISSVRNGPAKSRSTTSGDYYSVEKAFGAVKPVQAPPHPGLFRRLVRCGHPRGGQTRPISTRYWGETQDQVRETIARVRARRRPSTGEIPASACPCGRVIDRHPRGSGLEARRRDRRAGPRSAGQGRPGDQRPSAAQRGITAAAGCGQAWRPPRQATVDRRRRRGRRPGATPPGLVGTPEQVAEALLDYYDLGVSTFLIRGFDPLNDAIAYGRDLIPLTRSLVAQRSRRVVAAE